MSDIRTKAATDAFRAGWDACFGKGPNSRTAWDAMPHEHVEPPTRVLYRCPSCGTEVWDADTGNERRCGNCGDVMAAGCLKYESVHIPASYMKPMTAAEYVQLCEDKIAAARKWADANPATDAHCEPITRSRGPAVESFPSSSSSLPVARCPECNRPWSRE